MIDKIYVLNIPISNITKQKAKDTILDWFNQDKLRMIFTPNPEMIMAARADKELKRVIKSADMIVPDGIGVVWASRYSEFKLPERVAGYDLVQDLFKEMADTNKTVYFLGGEEKVVKVAKLKMRKKYKNLKIVGTHSGYFDKQEEILIINEINKLKPDLLLVGLGVPKQEKWIYKNRNKLNVKVCIGVGGSFDGMAGKVKRAPVIFQKMGLEWFYRLIKQPTRLKRMMQLPLFALVVIKKGKNKRKIIGGAYHPIISWLRK